MADEIKGKTEELKPFLCAGYLVCHHRPISCPFPSIWTVRGPSSAGLRESIALGGASGTGAGAGDQGRTLVIAPGSWNCTFWFVSRHYFCRPGPLRAVFGITLAKKAWRVAGAEAQRGGRLPARRGHGAILGTPLGLGPQNRDVTRRHSRTRCCEEWPGAGEAEPSSAAAAPSARQAERDREGRGLAGRGQRRRRSDWGGARRGRGLSGAGKARARSDWGGVRGGRAWSGGGKTRARSDWGGARGGRGLSGAEHEEGVAWPGRARRGRDPIGAGQEEAWPSRSRPSGRRGRGCSGQ